MSLRQQSRGISGPESCHVSHKSSFQSRAPSLAECHAAQYQEQLLRAALSIVRTPRAKRSGFRRDNPWPRPAPPRCGQASSPSICFWCFHSPPCGLRTRVCMLNRPPGSSRALESCSRPPSTEGEGGRADRRPWGEGGRGENRGCP